ncbi:DUF1285 domain-containing protein [Pelagibacterales bacterium]|jgi:hypothetical protein|nr:DUF1285 domain-containing protein [Pelagibacterales bacterium]|tara:strand:+ start:1715 stop:2293 length:579 start_codon:yes stop_codon:yes gene_type:complete
MPKDQYNFAKGLETIYEFSKKEKNSLPPVDKWNPEFCGDIDMKIMRNGKWFYMGTEIKRPAMVKLFSGILRLDSDNCYYLVTPVEKVRISVEDAPFIATSLISEKKDNINHLYFITNVNEKILLTKNNPLEIKINNITEEPSPYIFVRKNLKALISRSVFYELIELATKKNIDGKDCLVLASAGEVFKLYEY